MELRLVWPALAVTALSCAALGGCSGNPVTLASVPIAGASAQATPRATPTPTPTAIATASATPTPTPTPTPTATPPGSSAAIVLGPTAVTVSAQGTGCTTSAGFTASETGYSGSFTAVSQNTAVVTVAPGTTAGSFVVTSVTTQNGGLPQTAIVVTDSLGNSATETVSIATCLP